MLKLFKKLLVKKEKTIKEKLKPCDKFVVITNKEDSIIEAVIVEICNHEHEKYKIEKITEKEKIAINLSKYRIEIEPFFDNRKNTTGKIIITDINKNSTVPSIRIYTLEEQETIIAEPTNLVIDRFKIKVKQK